MLGGDHVLLETALGQGDVLAALNRARILFPVVHRDVDRLHVCPEAAAASKHHHTQLTLLLERPLMDEFLKK